jgi:hypothetical protein
MSHTVIYNSELHIVESKLHGDMTLGEVKEIIAKIAQMAKEKDCRLIFTDFTDLRVARSHKEHIHLFWH